MGELDKENQLAGLREEWALATGQIFLAQFPGYQFGCTGVLVTFAWL